VVLGGEPIRRAQLEGNLLAGEEVVRQIDGPFGTSTPEREDAIPAADPIARRNSARCLAHLTLQAPASFSEL
jgi:hypothetical protein